MIARKLSSQGGDSMEDLVRVATEAARMALAGWSPTDPHALEGLSSAIGQAVAAGIQRHEESNARHIASTMAGIDDDDDSGMVDWQV
jgi:hypothetical protein